MQNRNAQVKKGPQQQKTTHVPLLSVKNRKWKQETQNQGSTLPCIDHTDAGGLRVWGIFFQHTFGFLVPTELCSNTTVSLSVVADHMHPFMAKVYLSDGYFQHYEVPCYKAQKTLNWSVEHDNEFTAFKWLLHIPHLQQQRDAIISTWTRKSTFELSPR